MDQKNSYDCNLFGFETFLLINIRIKARQKGANFSNKNEAYTSLGQSTYYV